MSGSALGATAYVRTSTATASPSSRAHSTPQLASGGLQASNVAARTYVIKGRHTADNGRHSSAGVGRGGLLTSFFL